ncbi:kinase-like domain-containing protein [Sparassis latifolia]
MSDRENSHVAIKILRGHSTDLVRRRLIWELEALKLISICNCFQMSSLSSTPTHCLRLLSDFTFPDKRSAGDHMCFVTQVLGGDVNSLFDSHRQPFPLPLAKRTLLHVLRGIAHVHKCGVVHIDSKHDSIFFSIRMSTENFEALLTSDQSRRRHPKSTKSLLIHFLLPEILIWGPWNEKVDIWTFGCLIFEIVTGGVLFKYKPFQRFNLDELSYLLYTMLCYTCEDFSADQLTVSKWAGRFFDSTCNLGANPLNHKVIDEADVLSTGALMRRRLHLDPAEQASAVNLLSDPLFAGVD